MNEMNEKQLKEQANEINKIENDNNTKWKGLSNIIKSLEKKGMEIKECAYLQSHAEFIKGKILEENLKKNLDDVVKEVNKVMNTNIKTEDPNKAIKEIYQQFKSINMISKACREEGDKKKKVKRLLPFEVMCKLNNCNCGKDHNVEELDHEPKLNLEELNSFDPNFYYILNIQRSKSMVYLYLMLIIIGTLLYGLRGVWPRWFKVAIWWISYILLIIMLSIYAIRLIVYVFFFIFGYSVWLLPDIDDNNLGFFESFKRVISVEKQNVKWYIILLRVIVALTLSYIAFKIYRNPSILNEAKTILYEAIRDVYKFGEDKFVNNNQTAVRIKSIEEIDSII